MVPAHFDDVDSDLSDHNVGKTFWIVQNSENDLVTSIFIRILIGIIIRPGVFGGEVSPEKGIYGSVIFF